MIHLAEKNTQGPTWTDPLGPNEPTRQPLVGWGPGLRERWSPESPTASPRWMWLELLCGLLMQRLALVHLPASGSRWGLWACMVLARLTHTPVVLHAQAQAGGRSAHPAARHPPAWLGRLARSASHVVVGTPRGHATWARLAPEAGITVMPEPVPMPKGKASLRKGLPTVLFLDDPACPEGAQALLDAWPGVVKAVPEAQLVLGGPRCAPGAALRHRLARRGLEGHVQFRGWATDDARWALLRRAWVLALPAPAQAALPRAVLQAMAAGVPVVAPRGADMAWALQDGACGRLIEPCQRHALTQTLVELLLNEPLRHTLGQAAQRRARQLFSPQAHAMHLQRLHAQLLGPPPSPRRCTQPQAPSGRNSAAAPS